MNAFSFKAFSLSDKERKSRDAVLDAFSNLKFHCHSNIVLAVNKHLYSPKTEMLHLQS